MKSPFFSFVSAAALLFSFSLVAQAEDLTFTLTNNTETTLTRFYSSPIGTAEWEEDVFGDDVLEPGESMKITIGDGRTVCKYDMRFEFEDESTTEDQQDLCELGSYSIED